MLPSLSTGSVTPVSQAERIAILDSLRGIAILGILLMNIPGFGLPRVLFHDISVLNEWNGPNYFVWYLFDGFLEGTQRGLFSMLFGAGIILFISRLEKRTEGMIAAELFFRRQLWLLLFGLFNAFVLLWFWDILFAYAICGMVLFAFRRLPARSLLIAAFVSLLLGTARENRNLYFDKAVIDKGEKVARLDTNKIKLTENQKEELQAMQEIKDRSNPENKRKKMEKGIASVLTSYSTLYSEHSDHSVEIETIFLYYGIWDLFLFMLIGMAFLNLGILQGEAKTKIYAWMTVVGLGVGIPLSALYLEPNLEMKFNQFEIIKNLKFEFYQLARLFRSLGAFGCIMLLYKSGWFGWLFRLMRPVGQMALTNYLLQSFLCGMFFYGVGFGMFGKLDRYELYYVVLAVWVIQIFWSHLWLRYFRFGPFEWLWRSLTYWEMQPFRKPRPAI
jgi:uncharacterized protein